MGGVPGNDQFWPAFQRFLPDMVIVEPFVVRFDGIGFGAEIFPGNADWRAVGKMAAMRQRHAEDGVAGIQEGQVGRDVGRRTGIRLHVDMLGAKRLLARSMARVST